MYSKSPDKDETRVNTTRLRSSTQVQPKRRTGSLLSTNRHTDDEGKWQIKEYATEYGGASFVVSCKKKQISEIATFSRSTLDCAGSTVNMIMWGVKHEYQRRPNVPGSGYGRKTLLKVCAIYARAGAVSIDIANPNERATRSYLSAGFEWIPEKLLLRKVLVQLPNDYQLLKETREFHSTDYRGQWSFSQTYSTTEASWTMEIAEDSTKPSSDHKVPASSWCDNRRLNSKTSFSLPLQECLGKEVRITQHALYDHEHGRGFGADGLRHVLQLYQAAGAVAVLVKSPNSKCSECFKKCGMVWQGGNEFRVLFNQQSGAEEESTEDVPDLHSSSSDDEEESEDDDPTPSASGFAAPNAPREEQFITPGTNNVRLTEQLHKLIRHTGRPPQSHRSVMAAKRSVTRTGAQPGLAKQLASLFQEVIHQSNVAHELSDLYPVQLSHVLVHMDEGRPFLAAAETKKEKEALADAVVAVVDTAGRTCRSSVVGVVGNTVQGSLKMNRLAT
jgi:hypothetical protein